MAHRDDEPPAAEPEEGPVLAPEELDISDDEHVTQIDEGRFVVSPDARPTDDPAAADPSPPVESEPTPSADPGLDRRAVHDWLADDLDGATSRYGFDVTAKFDSAVTQRRLVSNDVVTIFESMVLWYAQQLDQETPVEQVLGILLAESSVPVRYPARSLQRLLDSTDLDPEDSIADLLSAVEAQDGLKL